MIYQSVSSTNVAAIGYDELTSTLGVKFHKGGTYHYLNVPKAVYLAFLGAHSKGSFVHERLKDRYPAVRK